MVASGRPESLRLDVAWPGFSRGVSGRRTRPRRKEGLARAVRAPGRVGPAPGARSLHGRYLAGVLAALAGAYYAAAKLGYELEFSGPVAAIVWLPAGVAIAFLCLGGLRFWPGVLVGDLLANDYSALPLGSALGQTFGNMLEVLVAALLIRRLLCAARRWTASAGSRVCSPRSPPRRRSARPSVRCRCGRRGDQHQRTGGGGAHLVARRRRRRADRDSVRARLVPPPARGWTRGRAVEALVMLAAVAGMSEIAFRSETPAGLSRLPGAGLGRGALRPPRRDARDRRRGRLRGLEHDALSRAVRVRLDHAERAQYPALHRRGGAVDAVPRRAGRRARRFAERLDASRARLVKASDTERRRLEHNLHDGAQQRLTALAIRLGIAAERAREAHEPGVLALDDARNEVVLAIDELRELSRGIHPSVLTDLGSRAALRTVAVRSTDPRHGRRPTALHAV